MITLNDSGQSSKERRLSNREFPQTIRFGADKLGP